MKGIAGALIMLITGLAFVLLAYSFVAYPIVVILNSTVSQANLWTDESLTLFRYATMALSIVGVITSVGLFIWFLARLTKREEFEWLR